MYKYKPDTSHTGTSVPSCKLGLWHILDNSNQACQRGTVMRQCEAYQEKTIALHQSDVYACNIYA